MTDFSVPQRMSLGAFVVYFLKFFRYIFNAAIILITYEIFKSGSGHDWLRSRFGVTPGIHVVF